MKKKITKKTQSKNTAVRGVNIKSSTRTREMSSWSMSIYVYWFIILFFIAATFFILGRSHMINKETTNPTSNPEVIEIIDTGADEETLMSASDYYIHSKTELAEGNIDGAIADLTAAIQADSNMVEAYIRRGDIYMQIGDYNSAMNDFNVALSIDASNPVAYYDRALLNIRLEDFNAAMNDINNALATYNSNPNEVLQLRDLYAKRGQLNLWMKNWEGAIADYTNSLARPDGTVSPNVYAERAEAYTAKGDYVDAINDYTSAMQVIKEQLSGVIDADAGEKLSRDVMLYTEKTAALYLKLDNKTAAKTSLEGAYQIAVALNDTETAENLAKLISDLQSSIDADTPPQGQVITMDQAEIATGNL